MPLHLKGTGREGVIANVYKRTKKEVVRYIFSKSNIVLMPELKIFSTNREPTCPGLQQVHFLKIKIMKKPFLSEKQVQKIL